MATDIAKLVVQLEAQSSKLQRDLDRANSKLDKFGNQADRVGKRVSGALSAAGRGLVGALGGLAVAGTFASIVREVSAVEKQLSAVAAVTGASASELERLELTARKLGASTRFSASEAASGMEFLGRAGFETNEIISALPGLLDLASAGALELGEAADIASNVLSGFGLQADEIGRVGDVLAKTAASANTNVQQLGQALSYSAPVAAAFGVSVEETAAAIGVLGNSGLQATRAGTGLNAILSALADPSTKAREAIEGLGITLGEVDPQTRSLTEIVQRFADAELSAADAVRIFGREAAPAFLSLASGTAEFKELTKANREANGTMRDMAQIMSDNLEGDFRSLGSAVDELKLKIGESGLTSALRTATQEFTNLVRGIGDAIVAMRGFNQLQANTQNLDLVTARMAALRAEIKETEDLIQTTEGFGPLLPGTGGELERLKTKLVELKAEFSFQQNKQSRLLDPNFEKNTIDYYKRVQNEIFGTPITIPVQVGKPKGIEDAQEAVSQVVESAETAATATTRATNTASNSVSQYIARLQEQVAALGLSSDAAKVNELITLGASEADITRIQSLQQQIAAFNELAEASRQVDADRERATALIRQFDPLSDLTEQIQEVHRLRDTFPELADALAEVEFELQDKFESIGDKAAQSADDVKSAWDELGPTFSSAFEDAIVSGKKFSDVLDGLEQDIIRIITRKAITEPLGNAVAGSFGGDGLFGDLLGSLFPGFATGGRFRVGGQGGTDSQLVAFRASPDEVVEVKTPAQQRQAGGVFNFSFALPSDTVDYRRAGQQVAREASRYLQTAMGAV